jgi:hypothetical protein
MLHTIYIYEDGVVGVLSLGWSMLVLYWLNHRTEGSETSIYYHNNI